MSYFDLEALGNEFFLIGFSLLSDGQFPSSVTFVFL